MHSAHVTTTEDTWIVWFKRVGFALGVSFVTLFFVYCYLRVRTVYENQLAVAVLRADVRELEERHSAQIKELEHRADELEKVLYGDVVAKLAKQPPGPTRIEIWQRNRDKELRERLIAIERWRMTIEHRVDQLQKGK